MWTIFVLCTFSSRSRRTVLLSLPLSQLLKPYVLFLFETDAYDMGTVASFFPLYFLLATWTYGLYVPSGLFVPCILTGAAWGRLFGLALQKIFPYVNWVGPGTYALIGAAATLGTVSF